jgi:isopenicillin-N N-acyltransferase-like protein
MFPVIDTRPALGAREQGARYGRRCAARIAHSRDTYARLFSQCGLSWAQARDKAVAMQPAIRALDPALLDEMRGIAEGSGLGFEDILALNCRSEILPADFLGDPAAQASAVFEQGECTAVGVAPAASADGKTWLAQNWDWIGTQRDALVLLRGHAWDGDTRGREFLTLTEAGMLAKIGMGVGAEPDRVAVGLNIIRSRHDGERPATPVHPLLRHLMTMPSLAAARARMDALQSGFGFGAGSDTPAADTAGEVAAFEVSPRGWREWPPEHGVMTHTNHFLCDALVPIQHPTTAYLSSETRLATARRHTVGRPVGFDALAALLRDEGGDGAGDDGYMAVCRSPDPAIEPDGRVESVAGVIMCVEDRAMWVAPGVPSTVDFERVA